MPNIPVAAKAPLALLLLHALSCVARNAPRPLSVPSALATNGVESAAEDCAALPQRRRLRTAAVPLHAAMHLRGGSDEPLRSPRGRGRGRGSGRGRGRGRGPSPQTAIVVNTHVIGEAVRNLTTWKDVSASALVFAVGNAAFASLFIGKTAMLLLWLAFLAGFLLPLRDVDASDAFGVATDALHSAVNGLKSLLAAVRERYAQRAN